MGDFKPLMTLNGFEMIRLTVQCMLDGGIDDVFVVVGRERERIEEVLGSLNRSYQQNPVLADASRIPRRPSLHFVENRDFATTDMLFSVQCALQAMMRSEEDKVQEDSALSYDAALIIPGDIPSFSPRTVVALCNQAHQSTADMLCPTYKQKKGHPLLIKQACFSAVRTHQEQGSLKQALAPFAIELLEVNDEGILLDADDPIAFERLEAYVRATKGVSEEVAEELLDRFETLPRIKAHCRAVAALTARMVEHLNSCGFGLDLELACGAALIHDINRLEKSHANVAETNLRAMGYDALAKVVGKHNDNLELGEEDHMMNEANIVFLADKLVRETELVTIDVRYALALEHYPAATEIGQRVRHDMVNCKKLMNRYTEITGDELSPVD